MTTTPSLISEVSDLVTQLELTDEEHGCIYVEEGVQTQFNITFVDEPDNLQLTYKGNRYDDFGDVWKDNPEVAEAYRDALIEQLEELNS